MGWGGREGQWITTLSSEASGQRAASLHLAEKLAIFTSSVTEHYNRRMLVISELAVTETLISKKKFSPTP
jgi:hypothetical protein